VSQWHQLISLPPQGLLGVDGGVLRVGTGGSVAGSWSTAWHWGQVGLAAEQIVLGAGRGRDRGRSVGRSSWSGGVGLGSWSGIGLRSWSGIGRGGGSGRLAIASSVG
ncbi:hypothetical protein M5D96_005068, partial [Drosophila gunungcola]